MAQRHVIQLQQEAALRVQRMAERSQQLVREHPVHIHQATTVTPQTVAPCAAPSPVPEACQTEMAAPPVTPCCEQKPRTSGGLSNLAGDPERVLLLLLIAVLGQNGAPFELLLALLYVAL